MYKDIELIPQEQYVSPTLSGMNISPIYSTHMTHISDLDLEETPAQFSNEQHEHQTPSPPPSLPEMSAEDLEVSEYSNIPHSSIERDV